jgi:starvation-inducible DNA-binding protein
LPYLLAGSYALYRKTYGLHWNVVGPMFNTLHEVFMDQHTENWNALDFIAKRIRALGHPAPASCSQFVKPTATAEEAGIPPTEFKSRQLSEGQEAVVRTARRLPMSTRLAMSRRQSC